MAGLNTIIIYNRKKQQQQNNICMLVMEQGYKLATNGLLVQRVTCGSHIHPALFYAASP
jgi:hypothetical protein